MTDAGPSRRDFEHLSVAVENLTRIIEALPDRMDAIYVRQKLYDSEQAAQNKEIEGLSSWRDLVFKVVMSAVLVALLGLVIVPRVV